MSIRFNPKPSDRRARAIIEAATLCVACIIGLTRVDAVEPDSAVMDGRQTTNDEQQLPEELSGRPPSDDVNAKAADAHPIPQSASPDGGAATDRVARIKTFVNKALTSPETEQVVEQVPGREEPRPELTPADARRQELRSLVVPPEGPVSEREARYMGQLRDEVADTIVVNAPGAQGPKVTAAEPARFRDETPRTYRVQTGDSLWKIAQAQFGDGHRWTLIYEANRDTLNNRNVLSIGQMLKIPE